MTWRTRINSAQQIRKMGQEYVVYDDLSGSTHLLGSAAGQILMCLELSPQDSAALITQLATVMEGQWQQAPQPEFEQGINAVLDELQTMDLIERV